MSALVALTLRQMLGGRKIWILALFLGLPVLLLAVVMAASGFDVQGEDAKAAAASVFLYVLYPQSLCILACLLYGSSLLAGEVEGKTLVYLFTRAQPRWKVVLGKYVATSLALSVLTVASMSLCFLIAGMPVGWRLWLALFSTVVGACFAYTAIFALLGLIVPRRAIPVGLIYAVVVEVGLSFVPALVNEITASYYLRSLAFHVADLPLEQFLDDAALRNALRIFGGATMLGSVTALVAIPLLALGLSALLVHRREWPLTEGV